MRIRNLPGDGKFVIENYSHTGLLRILRYFFRLIQKARIRYTITGDATDIKVR